MGTSLKAGFVYFLIVFMVGFVLGAVRLFVLEPSLGTFMAVLVEMPVILAISWFVCRWIVAKQNVADAFAPRALMGASALVFLIGAEIILAVSAFGESVPEFFASFGRVDRALGLFGQIIFAAFPLLQRQGSKQLRSRASS